VQKYRFVNDVQRYKCSICGKQFLGGHRLDNVQIWEEYTDGKQTYAQLSERFSCSIKTIQRRIDAFNIDKTIPIARIVCDVRKGLIQSFIDIPVQMCQFHQSAIIRRYLTKRPKLKAAQELMEVVDLMKHTDKESFVGALSLWFEKWEDFLNERTVNPLTNKSFYETVAKLFWRKDFRRQENLNRS